MPGSVFLSYAREDGAFALRLAGDLRSAGLEVWIDQLSIAPGSWDESVQKALAGAGVVLVVLSLASASAWSC